MLVERSNMPFKSIWENPFKKSAADHESDIAFFSKVPIFDTLTRRQKLKINSLIHIRHFNKDEIVFRQDDPGVGLYIVRDGQVEVYREYDDKTRNKIASLKKGDFFGDISLLNDSPRSATVVASQKTVLLGFFKTDLLNLMDSDPKLGVRFVYQLARIVAERLRLVNEGVYE